MRVYRFKKYFSFKYFRLVLDHRYEYFIPYFPLRTSIYEYTNVYTTYIYTVYITYTCVYLLIAWFYVSNLYEILFINLEYSFYFDYSRALLCPNSKQFADTILNTRMFNTVYSVRVHNVWKFLRPKSQNDLTRRETQLNNLNSY